MEHEKYKGYKDKEARKKYMRNLMRKRYKPRKRLIKYLTKEELKERDRIYSRNTRIKRKNLIEESLGKNCFICGDDGRISFASHRKDGLKHKKFSSSTLNEIQIELQSLEYVRLCYRCHKCVHWLMDYFNMSWNNILNLLPFKHR